MSDLFTPGPVPTAAAPVVAPLISRSPLLDAEKLHVYRLAVQFQALANRLVPRQRGELPATLRDQLDRASVSIVLNIAEAMVPHCLRISDGHEKRGDWAR